MSRKKIGGYGFGWGFDDYFKDLESQLGDFSARFADKEKIREWKKKVVKEGEKALLPIRVNVSPFYDDNGIEAFHSTRFVVNASPSFVNNNDDKSSIKKLIKALSKLPNKSHKIHSGWVAAYLTEMPSRLTGTRTAYIDAYKAVIKYFDGLIPYEDVITHFENTDAKDGTPNVGGLSDGTFSGGKEVGKYIPFSDLTLYKDALKTISKKLLKEVRGVYVPSIRNGNRINRDYVNKSSYKPLLEKVVSGTKKPRILIVHDCSGSMGYGLRETDPARKAVSYIAALVNSGVVDVTHVVYHSSWGWKDMVNELKEGKIAQYSGDSEGFQYLDDNLPSEWAKEVDFVVVTTDLEYSTDAENGIYNYVKRAKAHQILSFKNEGTVKDLCVTKVSSIKDMVNATIKLVR